MGCFGDGQVGQPVVGVEEPLYLVVHRLLLGFGRVRHAAGAEGVLGEGVTRRAADQCESVDDGAGLDQFQRGSWCGVGQLAGAQREFPAQRLHEDVQFGLGVAVVQSSFEALSEQCAQRLPLPQPVQEVERHPYPLGAEIDGEAAWVLGRSVGEVAGPEHGGGGGLGG